MQKIFLPKQNEWSALWVRPAKPVAPLENTVECIFEDVKCHGDKAVLAYTRKYDCTGTDTTTVKIAEIAKATMQVPTELKNAIALAAKNIEAFHSSQKDVPKKIETVKGVVCWRESKPIEYIGIYIPGGTAPLFSTVLMLGIPARLAGCREIVLCTPPGADGDINPAILYAASITGINAIFKVGGAQAIAALTFGTETIPKVDKIFGPGNQYVTAAKSLAQRYGMTIDLPAGPSELLVIADANANPAFVAADLLSQAEHGEDSQVILVSDDENTVDAILAEVTYQISLLPRKLIAEAAIENSRAVILNTLSDCMLFSNGYAPEHLILATANASALAETVTNAGSVFIGYYSCESTGDYASGTNHTLPTNSYARSYSGVSLDSFIKKITFQSVTREGLNNIGPAIEIMAEAEGLHAHKEAVSVRLRYQQ